MLVWYGRYAKKTVSSASREDHNAMGPKKSGSPDFPDPRHGDGFALEGLRCPDCVAPQRSYPASREKCAPVVAQQDPASFAPYLAQPRSHPSRQEFLVPDIASKHHVPSRRCSDEVGVERGDTDAVEACVGEDRLPGKRIGVRRLDRARTGPGGRDRAQARAASDVEDREAAHERRVVEDVSRDGLAAGPRDAPEGRWQAELPQPCLLVLPQLGEIGGEVTANLRAKLRCRYRGRLAQER